jgi:hypothetical protein
MLADRCAMNPVPFNSIASSAAALASKCRFIIQNLYELRDKYKNANPSTTSMIQECRTMELAWRRLERWTADEIEGYEDAEQLCERIEIALHAGQLAMTELERELSSTQTVPILTGFLRRNRYIWNDMAFEDHQDRIQCQVGVLTVLLEAIQL